MPLPQLRTDYGPDPNMLMMAMRNQRENQLLQREDEQRKLLGNALAQGMGDDPQLANIMRQSPEAGLKLMQVQSAQAEQRNALQKVMRDEENAALDEAANLANYIKHAPPEQRQQLHVTGFTNILRKYPRVAQKYADQVPAEPNDAWYDSLIGSRMALKDQMDQNKITYQDFNEGNEVVKRGVKPSGEIVGEVARSPRWQPYKPDLKDVVDPVTGETKWAYISPESGARKVPGVNAPERKGTTVNNIMDRGNLEEQKEYGKYLVNDEYKPIASRASTASDLLTQLNIAKNIDVQTGALQPLKEKIAKYAQEVNVDPETFGLQKADNAQALTGVMQNIVLHKMQAQKGPQTENDAKRIESTVANLGNTPEAFRFLMDTAIATEERAIEQRNFYDQYMEKKNTFRGAAKAWEKYKSDAPLVGKNPTTGKPILYNQFKAVIMQNNPNLSEQDIAKYWRENYVK